MTILALHTPQYDIKSNVYLARSGLSIRENGAVVAVHDAHHKIRRAHIVNMLLFHLVVEHGVEKEVLGRFRIICLGVSNRDLATFRISRGSSIGTFDARCKYNMNRLCYNEHE